MKTSWFTRWRALSFSSKVLEQHPIVCKAGASRQDGHVGRFHCWGWGKPGLPIVWELTSGDPCQADALEKEMAMLGWRMPGRLHSKTGTWLNMHACSHAGTHAHRRPCTHALRHPLMHAGGQARSHAPTHASTYVPTHPRRRSGTRICSQMPTQARIRTTHTHTRAHACAHKNPYSWAPKSTVKRKRLIEESR